MSRNIRVTSGDAYLLVGSDDRRLTVTVTKAGVDRDLTDTVPTFMVKRYRGAADADALITKTIGNGLVLASPQSGATKGKAYISLDEADTADLGGRYPWELSAEDAVGIITLASGWFRVSADMIEGA